MKPEAQVFEFFEREKRVDENSYFAFILYPSRFFAYFIDPHVDAFLCGVFRVSFLFYLHPTGTRVAPVSFTN